MLHQYSPGFPVQTTDVSYGILSGDLSSGQFMSVPTPGAMNDSTLPAHGAVTFSHPSQTFTGTLAVALTPKSVGCSTQLEPTSKEVAKKKSPLLIKRNGLNNGGRLKKSRPDYLP